MPASILSSGDAVEVFADDGSDTWRPARIVHPFASRPLYFVSFDCEKEVVSADRVRPVPERDESSGFELHQLVDAFVGGVWRPGVVSKARVAEREGRCVVCFPSRREEVEFGAEDVRVRRDWIDGKWVNVEVKGISEALYSIGNQVEVSHVSNEYTVAWYRAVVMKAVDEKIFLVEYESLRTEGDTLMREIVASQFIRPQPPLTLESKSYNLLDKVEAFYKFGWWRGVISKITADSKYHVKFMHLEIELSHSELRHSYDWFDEQWILASQDETTYMQLLDASNGAYKYLIPDSESGNLDRLTYPNQTECFQPCKKAKKVEATEISVQLLDSKCIEDSDAVKTGFDVNTLVIDEEPNFRIKDLVEKCCSTSPFNEGLLMFRKEVRNRAGEKKRKNSRPQRLRIIEPSLEGESMGNRRDIEVVGEPLTGGLSTTQPEARTTCGICIENGLFNAMVRPLNVNLVETSTSCAQICEAGSETKNEPLVSTVGKQFTNRSHIEKAGDASTPQPSPLPFEKRSFMWDSIEAMEVFSLLPQQPHFRPLEQYSKDFREGMAIGLMVTFSKLVNSICKLQIIDSRHKFDEILKSLVHLEGHGFEVQQIRACLVQLIRMKDNQDLLVSKRAAMEVLLMKKRREKVEFNEDIRSAEKSSRVLEQSLYHLYEERNYLLERKRKNDAKLNKLIADCGVVEDSLVSARHDFEATLSAAW